MAVFISTRRISRMPADRWESELVALCAPAGVAVVLTPEIPKAMISGAARWIKDKAVIQLSLKYKTDDQFWFRADRAKRKPVCFET